MPTKEQSKKDLEGLFIDEKLIGHICEVWKHFIPHLDKMGLTTDEKRRIAADLTHTYFTAKFHREPEKG